MVDLNSNWLKISRLDRAEKDAAEFEPEIIVSLLDPRMRSPQFSGVPSLRQHCSYYFVDKEDAGTPGMKEAVHDMVRLGWTLADDGRHPRVLLHCHYGASRSPAAAFIFMCSFNPEVSPQHHFLKLTNLLTNKPAPNTHMIEIADQFSGCHGKMLTPAKEYQIRYPRRRAAHIRLQRRQAQKFGVGSS